MVSYLLLSVPWVIRPLLTAALIASVAAPAHGQFSTGCVGDCKANRDVTVGNLLILVNIALGEADSSACPHGIPPGARVDIAMIIQALNVTVGNPGCPVLGPGDCCQCADFCASPVDGTCGACSVVVGEPCISGLSCAATPTPSPPPGYAPTPKPTPTMTPGEGDCCQCPTSCAAPIDGSCGGCTIVFHAACREGMLCVGF